MARRAATAAARAPAERREPRPRPPRRVSGPARTPSPRGAAHPRAGAVLDALLHGQAWIALVGVLLVGIVFFNVDLLQLNRSIATSTNRAAQVKQQNARLRLEVARLASTERIQRTAANQGLVLPAPGDVRYLRANPSVDGAEAAVRAGDPQADTTPTASSGPSRVAPRAPVAQSQPQRPPAVGPATGVPSG
jgi:cell division protein FtsL